MGVCRLCDGELRSNLRNKAIGSSNKIIVGPQISKSCYFTKYCKELAEQLGIGGWVKNSKKGTIQGKIQGTKAQLDHMIDWLSTTGSPGCKIEKCDLTNWEYMTRIAYTDFTVRF